MSADPWSIGPCLTRVVGQFEIWGDLTVLWLSSLLGDTTGPRTSKRASRVAALYP